MSAKYKSKKTKVSLYDLINDPKLWAAKLSSKEAQS